jgi:hypothetical protein
LPGQQVCFERSPGQAHVGAPDSAAASAESLTAFLTFRDTTGIRWTVREDGTFSDISPTPDARSPHD